MTDDLAESLLAVCRALNAHGVEYLVVGGTAVALHGYYRVTMLPSGAVADKPDVDVWYNPTYGNYFRLLQALEALGQDVRAFREEQSPNPKKSFFKYEFEAFTLDLLPELKAALPFGASYRNREVLSLHDVALPLIGLDDLLADKAANARSKDLIDIAQLRANQQLGGE